MPVLRPNASFLLHKKQAAHGYRVVARLYLDAANNLLSQESIRPSS
jgi:hypothetical protein